MTSIPTIASVSPAPLPFIDLQAQHRTIKTEVAEAVTRVFESQAFVLGDEVNEFECDVAEYCDSRDAVGCASGSDALLLSLMALEIGSGDEVITSPFTFFATAGAICRTGAKPVFVDIDPVTYNINVNAIESAITPRTKAIIPVHLFGLCAEMDPIWRMATTRGLSVIEDACQAIGAEYNGRRAGVLGRTGCFSFFPTKNLGGAGDGGLITTDDADIAARLRRLRCHGDLGGYTHQEMGFNSRLDALQAAVLKVKLRHLESWTESRRQNAALYRDLFDEFGLQDELELPFEGSTCRHVYNQFTVRVRDGRRDAIKQSLTEQQIGCMVYYPKPLHLQQCFAGLGYGSGDMPESERASAEVLSLPIFAELTAAQQERVVRGLAVALGHSVPATRTIVPFKMPATRAA